MKQPSSGTPNIRNFENKREYDSWDVETNNSDTNSDMLREWNYKPSHGSCLLRNRTFANKKLNQQKPVSLDRSILCQPKFMSDDIYIHTIDKIVFMSQQNTSIL